MTLLFIAALLTSPTPAATGGTSAAKPDEYGPFFEAEAPSDAQHATQPRKGRKHPVLSVGGGAFCFIEGSHCKASMILSAGVAAGMRIPASDEGPDMPYAQFSFRGGIAVRPLMFKRRPWHAWGVGVVTSWSRGTGSVTISGSSVDEDPEVADTQRTDAWRIGVINQLWLSKKPHALHVDFTIGTVRSEVLTSGSALFGTHAEVGFNWGGWGGVFAGGDFLDSDTRIMFGLRGHGFAAGPVIAAAILGLVLGGAM